MAQPSKRQWLMIARQRQEDTFEEEKLEEELDGGDMFDIACWICAALLETLHEPLHQRLSTRLSSLQRIVSSRCTAHSAVFQYNEALLQSRISVRKPAFQRLLYVYPDPCRTNATPLLHAPWELLELDKPPRLFSVVGVAPSPRIVDEDWIDIDLLTSWVTECELNHADCGEILAKTQVYRFQANADRLLLVDTQNECLISGSMSSSRYVALSYIWGKSVTFVTLKENVRQLKRPRSLAENNPRISLPKTIRQAIMLTRALGQRYLWVDALCIVQDGDNKWNQIQNMAFIYARAALTIIAAEGENADAGFRGLENISSPRKIMQQCARLSPDYAVVRPSSKQIWDDSVHQQTRTRGWCFQEELFSRRKLIFAANSVRWRCRCAQWSEESDSPDCLRTHGTFDQQQASAGSPERLLLSPLPTLAEYEALVNGFNSRQLSYPEDACSAFMGICTQLGAKFRFGLVSGLPELFFDICLLWRPLRRDGPLMRRRAANSKSDFLLPSWSWLGWASEVTFPYTWNLSDDPSGPIPAMVGVHRPEVFVPMQASYSGKDISPLGCYWRKYAEKAMDEELPSGWTRHSIHQHKEGRTMAHDFAPGARKELQYYRHEFDPSEKFWFPIILCEEAWGSTLAPELLIETWTSRFKLGQVRGMMTRILTLDGEPAGTLWQHDEEDDAFVLATTGDITDRPSIEVIAVVDSYVPRSEAVVWDLDELLSDEHLDSRYEPKVLDHVCNVIWIGREGGVAYRKATGVVDIDVWRASDLVEEEITLV